MEHTVAGVHSQPQKVDQIAADDDVRSTGSSITRLTKDDRRVLADESVNGQQSKVLTISPGPSKPARVRRRAIVEAVVEQRVASNRSQADSDQFRAVWI